MWWLIKTSLSLFLLGLLVYAAFSIPLGDKTFAAHVYEVWQAPVVQEKIQQLKEYMEDSWHKLVDKTTQHAGIWFGNTLKDSTLLNEHISDHDRKALEKLLNPLPSQSPPTAAYSKP